MVAVGRQRSVAPPPLSVQPRRPLPRAPGLPPLPPEPPGMAAPIPHPAGLHLVPDFGTLGPPRTGHPAGTALPRHRTARRLPGPPTGHRAPGHRHPAPDRTAPLTDSDPPPLGNIGLASSLSNTPDVPVTTPRSISHRQPKSALMRQQITPDATVELRHHRFSVGVRSGITLIYFG